MHGKENAIEPFAKGYVADTVRHLARAQVVQHLPRCRAPAKHQPLVRGIVAIADGEFDIVGIDAREQRRIARVVAVLERFHHPGQRRSCPIAKI